MINEPCPAHYHKCSEHSWPGLVSGVCLDDSLGWQVQVSWVSSLLSLCLTFPPFQCKNNFISPARAPSLSHTVTNIHNPQLMLALQALVDCVLNHDLGIMKERIGVYSVGMFASMKTFHWPKWFCPDCDVPLLEKRKLRPEM